MKASSAYVGMFDVLGFKQLRSQLGTELLASSYERLIFEVSARAAAYKVVLNPGAPGYLSHGGAMPLLGASIMSDTLIAYTVDASLASLNAIINFSLELIPTAFRLGLPLRGAIAFGDLLLKPDSNLIVGSAIEKAYLLEQSQVWAGCLLDDDYFFNYVENDVKTYDQFHDIVYQDQHRTLPGWVTTKLIQIPCVLQNRSNHGENRYLTQNRVAINWAPHVDFVDVVKSFKEPATPHARRIVSNTIAFKTSLDSFVHQPTGHRVTRHWEQWKKIRTILQTLSTIDAADKPALIKNCRKLAGALGNDMIATMSLPSDTQSQIDQLRSALWRVGELRYHIKGRSKAANNFRARQQSNRDDLDHHISETLGRSRELRLSLKMLLIGINCQTGSSLSLSHH